ncbi:uncharacterized protein LACBIDRAFT_326753 [Laccaria bicolor S238N-H82]|uniref:Predicted protein n=1 Tax=Laccaria bicolor (strain S238N-H82 / ATCC MYA-4686) TaxID=486041 RepID=B0D9K4_LACBS|nr:uncharacterized protein LACBIDRAFT_326753 [Laccaria bicolor S238N-H82]EDR08367.1 predicted protein [Laccaria bicolor S238N-H82]|eukprot:XP_001880592.1 predicted protein [Laccaria bicolor S238N-H82]
MQTKLIAFSLMSCLLRIMMGEMCHESGHIDNVPNVGKERGVLEIEGKPGKGVPAQESHTGIWLYILHDKVGEDWIQDDFTPVRKSSMRLLLKFSSVQFFTSF